MLLLAAAALALGAASVAGLDTMSLAKAREQGLLKFIPMTVAERDQLLSNVEAAFQVWPHLESKIKNYGPAADPRPTLKRLRDNIATVTDDELQLGISDSFVRVRDLHTTFTMTGPYSCFTVSTGLYLEFVEGSRDVDNDPKIVITSTTQYAPYLEILGPDYAKIRRGDELTHVNGMPFVEWFRKNQFQLGNGANDSGGMRRALDYLTNFSGSQHRLSADDSITFTFRNQSQSGKPYTAALNFVADSDYTCLSVSAQLYQKRTNITLPGTPSSASSFARTKPKPASLSPSPVRKLDPIRFPLGMVDTSSFPAARAAPIGLIDFAPIDGAFSVSWGIVDPKGRNMGVIQVSDFNFLNDVSGDPIITPINAIRSVLANQLKDTNSLLIDLRNNPGGIITLANTLLQLFGADIPPFQSRYIRTNVSYNLFVRNGQFGQDWVDAWSKAGQDDRYTPTVNWTTAESVNSLGQVYFRPVGVFTNGRCFSSCDMFAAGIQDNGLGTIFGEDATTGAGGANVFELADLQTYDPIDFKPMPLVAELATPWGTTYANTMRAAVRQSVRTGRYAGALIEDIGVKSDFVIRPRPSDVLGGGTSTQYDRIAQKLKDIGKQTGQRGLYFIAEPLEREITTDALTLPVEVEGFEQLTIVQDDAPTEPKSVRVPAGRQNLTLPLSLPGGAVGKIGATIMGTRGGKQAFKVRRTINVKTGDADRVDVTRAPFVFTGLGKAVGVFNSAITSTTDGWNNANGTWRTGDGLGYHIHVDSSIQVFMKAPIGTNLTINVLADIDIFPKRGLFCVNVVNDGGPEDWLLHGDGVDATYPGAFGLNTMVNKSLSYTTQFETFAVSVRFLTYTAPPRRGATLRSLNITAA
ncbi:hypothetical protein HK105_206020 [Polyrhizophydium stewartii]|uniref:Tail specific protease domain-containing protein n=1 Tax=Polyrhizophydium stewartii TaxID=2732419 RepID=A0ABR4N4J2_9FUNG